MESGVSSAGLTTQVLPAAMAGAMPQPQSTEREVPRHNETTRPPGVPHHRGLVAGDRDGGVEGEALCEVAKVANCVDEVLDVILGLRRDLAQSSDSI